MKLKRDLEMIPPQGVMVDQEETQTLLDLIKLNGHLDDLISVARSASGDLIDEVVFLDPEDALGVLRKFLSGDISTQELSKWPEFVYFLDTIGVAEEHQDVLIQFLFEISTPELFFEVNRETCLRWVSRLRQEIG
ncbi:hypothetical protein [Streptomyces milbemycinicus]|uniref:Uncharacterized protein n=1 Tax=Streptomyces milbemycinicus TaxID=476552 RepID=A0ABW8LU02_9ACTN